MDNPSLFKSNKKESNKYQQGKRKTLTGEGQDLRERWPITLGSKEKEIEKGCTNKGAGTKGIDVFR